MTLDREEDRRLTPEQRAEWRGQVSLLADGLQAFRMLRLLDALDAKDMAIRELKADIDAAEADYDREYQLRKQTQRLVGSLPGEMAQEMENRWAEADRLHARRVRP